MNIVAKLFQCRFTQQALYHHMCHEWLHSKSQWLLPNHDLPTKHTFSHLRDKQRLMTWFKRSSG